MIEGGVKMSARGLFGASVRTGEHILVATLTLGFFLVVWYWGLRYLSSHGPKVTENAASTLGNLTTYQ